MVRSVWGVVKEGVIVPDAPLPEGQRVVIVLAEGAPAVPPELREEWEAWDRASANALDLTERLVQEPVRGDEEPFPCLNSTMRFTNESKISVLAAMNSPARDGSQMR
jgi:hypothetical protein